MILDALVDGADRGFTGTAIFVTSPLWIACNHESWSENGCQLALERSKLTRRAGRTIDGLSMRSSAARPFRIRCKLENCHICH